MRKLQSDDPIWECKIITVDFTLLEFDMSFTSVVFKSRFNELKQIYFVFCHMCTGGSEVETKVAFTYICAYGTRSYILTDYCIFYCRNRSFHVCKNFFNEKTVIFFNSMSLSIESKERNNPLENRVSQTCEEILTKWKYITCCLSHPGLGWQNVFSSFPPRPPLQRLLHLTSKPFELNFRYFGQRIYRSAEMYWMTFPWPWPKLTAVASISKNLLFCTIKQEPLIWSLQNVVALLP